MKHKSIKAEEAMAKAKMDAQISTEGKAWEDKREKERLEEPIYHMTTTVRRWLTMVREFNEHGIQSEFNEHEIQSSDGKHIYPNLEDLVKGDKKHDLVYKVI